MGKFRIEENPTFTADVEVFRAGGAKITVPFTFRYFAQDELYAMQEEWSKRRESAIAEVKDRGLSAAELAALRTELEACELMEIVESWDFEEEVSEDSIRKFINALPSNRDSAMDAFTKGLNPAKLGN